MEVLTKAELRLRFDEILNEIKKGAVFIYPTDTIYGIGCDALNEKAVGKIREIKERESSPFSVWVPSLDWIKKNCVVSEENLKVLPGPYTLILKLKNKQAIAKNVVQGETIGVRYPDHWFAKVVEVLGVPIITTSANKSGEAFMTRLKDLDKDIEAKVDFIVYEGPKEGRPSKIINVVEGKVKER